MNTENDAVREAIADELRAVADDLENDAVTLTESPTVTLGWDQDRPKAVELAYHDGRRERTIEVWSR